MLQPASEDNQALENIIKGLTTESQLLCNDLQSIYSSKQDNILIDLNHFSKTSLATYSKLLFLNFQNKNQFDNQIDKLIRQTTINCLEKLK